MKLSKEQKELEIAKLTSLYGVSHLLCDGYRVTLSVERTSALAFRVMTYVNGEFKGFWMSEKNECPESKFLRKVTRPICSPKHKKEMENIIGKRRVAADPYYSKTHTHFMPDWANGKQAINHLCKVCESVELADLS